MNSDTFFFDGPMISVVPTLTPREMEVVQWIGEGKRNAEIGLILGVSRRTVDKHIEHIFEKLGVETRTAAARMVFGIQRQLPA